MKTMCPPGNHHNGFVANHALGWLIYNHISFYTRCIEKQKKQKNFYIPTCVGKKIQIYRFHNPRKCIVSRQLSPKFILLRPRQREITHSAWQHSFEKLFPPAAERGWRKL